MVIIKYHIMGGIVLKILVADNLCKCYGKNENKIRAVNNVSLEVMEGALVAIMGPSGSGKVLF